jgi:hypothetical protein
VRYTDIATSQKGANGQNLDFGNVKNIWGKSDNGEGNVGDLYGDIVLGVIPFGDLPRDQRRELLQLIHDRDVYTVDYNKVSRKIVNGRPQYSYRVLMDPAAYVSLLKEFGTRTGIKPLESLDPAVYAGQSQLTFILTVDVWSHHLASILYGDSNRYEVFGGYGISKTIQIPKDSETIPVEQLQERIQSIQYQFVRYNSAYSYKLILRKLSCLQIMNSSLNLLPLKSQP